MKLLLILFACVCLQNPPQTDSTAKKKTTPPKKEKRASLRMAPSILILDF
jgi:hypothetical protein